MDELSASETEDSDEETEVPTDRTAQAGGDALTPLPAAWHSLTGHALFEQTPPTANVCVAIADVLRCQCVGKERKDAAGRKKTAPSAMPRHLLLGLTLDGMRQWLKELPTPVAGRWAAGHPNGYDAQQHANAASASDGRSVCERLAQSWQWLGSSHHVGSANVYVCWPLSTSLECLLDGLEHFISLHARKRTETFFWIWCVRATRPATCRKHLAVAILPPACHLPPCHKR